MFQSLAVATCLALLGPKLVERQPAERFRLQQGDCVVLVGDALVEHEQFHGYLETRLVRHVQQGKVTFRNLGWSGDTVRGGARTSGYQNPEGMERLLRE